VIAPPPESGALPLITIPLPRRERSPSPLREQVHPIVNTPSWQPLPLQNTSRDPFSDVTDLDVLAARVTNSEDREGRNYEVKFLNSILTRPPPKLTAFRFH